MSRYFGKEDLFNLDKDRTGLQIAFGLTEYPITSNEILYEPQYATIELQYAKWGESAVVGTKSQHLSMGPCTPEELGLGPQGYSDPRSKFYPMSDNTAGWLSKYAPKLQCAEQNIDVLGDYNSDVAQLLNIQLVKCNRNIRDDCAPEEELTQWLRRKFIIVITNNERFEPTVYTDERVT